MVAAKTIFNKMKPLEDKLEKFINHHHEHMHVENSNQVQAESVPQAMYTGTASQFVESPYLKSSYLESSYLESPYLESPYLKSSYLESPYLESPYLESPYLGFTILPNWGRVKHGIKTLIENEKTNKEITNKKKLPKQSWKSLWLFLNRMKLMQKL